MVYLEYEKIKLPVLDGYNITKSSQEIAYSDLKCDFTGRTAVELPQKYEEVKVVEERDVDTIIEEPIEKTIEDFKNTTFETKVDSEIEITKIKGEHRQESREGYNLLNLEDVETTTENGITFSIKKGIIQSINGTPKSTSYLYLYTFNNEITLKAGTYTLFLSSPITNTYVALLDKSSTWIGQNVKSGQNSVTFTLMSDANVKYVACGDLNTSKTVSGKNVGVMLVSGSTIPTKFEQYGASPSPDYPSEIETVKDSVEIDIVNKNLFDKNKALRGYELNGTTGKTSSNSLFFTSDYIRVNPNGQYFLSGKHDGTSNCFYDKNKRYIDKVVLKNGLLTVPDNSDIYYLRINARLTSIDTTMIEKGTEKTDYVEGKSQSIIMPIQQEMLEGDYIKDVEHHEWKKLVLTGDEDVSQDDIYQGIAQYSIPADGIFINDLNIRAISNCFKGVYWNNSWEINNSVTINDFRRIRFMTSQYTTVDSFKAFLKSKYDEGNPVIVYYKLATPVNLELTDEQKKGLKKVQVKKGLNHMTSEASISVKYTEDMIPKKQKRIKQNLLCYGYVDNYVFPELREQDKDIDINFTLLSPSKMSTLRTCTAVGTYKLKELLEKVILKPLLDDGFNLKELNVTDRSVTVNFLCKTLEYCLNNLSNKFNIWCNIDEQKNIYIKDIELIWNEGKIKHIYDDEHSIRGLQYIKPSTSSDDYANVINFTNVRIYEYSRVEFSDSNMKIMTQNFNPLIVEQISNIKNGEQITLEIPVDIKKENILKSVYSRGESDGNAAALRLGGVYTDNTVFNISILYDKEKDTVVLSDNLGIENEEGKDKEFLLIKDSFFSNLIVGIKYNGQKTLKAIKYISSDSVLVWSINKFYNNKAINEEKNRISKTGIVETTVDMKESWKTAQELREIGTTYMNKNGLKLDGQVELKTDEDVFKVGDTIKINKMIVNGVYVVTDIQIDCSNNDLEYIVTCKNANMLSSFIDIFRSEDTQETNDKTYHLYLTHYNQEEFAESHEVIQ
ncbi:MAG: hypothetical protein ACLS90_01565 [Clostridia bacterium]